MNSFVLSLTLFRILAAPFIFITSIFLEYFWVTFWLFNLAALTDYLDGKLARFFRVESKLGAILDPIGDKLLVLFALITLVVITNNIYIAFMGSVILAREFWVSALREYSSSLNAPDITSVTLTAKIKTTFQFVAISLFFFGIAANQKFISFLASFVLFVAVLLAAKSAIDYTKNIFLMINKD